MGVVGMGAVILRSPAPALLSPHPHPPLPPGQTYYGQVLKKSADLQTNACVTAARPVPKHIREALNNVHEEVALRYYGCGLVIPEHLENCWILDLGSGSGRDCYALSQLVGEMGHVTGIDMTESQVEVAKKYIEYHMEKYGFQTPNVTFHRGYTEKLEETGIKNESYDIVISNCVINLVPDKQQVLQEVHRVLKHGGELYFSDVYASLELPEEIRTRRVLWGECLGGALYWKDLAILAQKIGFCRPRLVSANLITVQNEELERVIGDCRFVSATFRLFKLPKTGPAERCQVIYNGGITGHEKELIFDANFTFKEGEIVEVDEETAAILKNSRFAQDFLIRPIGEKLSTCRGCSALESKAVSQRLLTRCPMNGLEGIHEPLKIIGMYVYFSQERVYYFHQIVKGVQIQKKIKSYLGKYYSNIQIFVSLHEIVKMPYRKTVPVYMPTSNA